MNISETTGEKILRHFGEGFEVIKPKDESYYIVKHLNPPVASVYLFEPVTDFKIHEAHEVMLNGLQKMKSN